MSLTDLPQVQALSVREKLVLVDELWKSVSDDLDQLAVSDEEKNLLNTRWADFLADPTKALSVEQLRSKVADLRG